MNFKYIWMVQIGSDECWLPPNIPTYPRLTPSLSHLPPSLSLSLFFFFFNRSKKHIRCSSTSQPPHLPICVIWGLISCFWWPIQTYRLNLTSQLYIKVVFINCPKTHQFVRFGLVICVCFPFFPLSWFISSFSIEGIVESNCLIIAVIWSTIEVFLMLIFL